MTFGSQIRQRYGWSIPNEASLRTIARYSPLLEIGGGRGYWSSLLGKHGADVVSFEPQLYVFLLLTTQQLSMTCHISFQREADGGGMQMHHTSEPVGPKYIMEGSINE
jgi:hypothetical protein